MQLHMFLTPPPKVMDNLLVQVSGRKRVVLFSPRDASNLYLIGDKSQVLDIDTPDLSAYPHFAQVNIDYVQCTCLYYLTIHYVD